MGGFEARTQVFVEPTLTYHPFSFTFLTLPVKPGGGHCQVGSLTGAVASERVTEESKAYLIVVGNHEQSVKV